jgi:hypothetical protein
LSVCFSVCLLVCVCVFFVLLLLVFLMIGISSQLHCPCFICHHGVEKHKQQAPASQRRWFLFLFFVVVFFVVVYYLFKCQIFCFLFFGFCKVI